MGELRLDEFGDRMIKLLPKLKIELCCYENSTLTRRDITTTQLIVLECLSTCGHCKMHTLVDALKVKFSGVTALIDRLVKTGFVIREHGKEDRRTVFVSLSTKGKKVLLEVNQQRRKAFIQVFSRVSARERENYLTILEKIVESFSYHSHQSNNFQKDR
jgi:MarR family transcriptional regulator, organic hydroperoxide resistance regulator